MSPDSEFGKMRGKGSEGPQEVLARLLIAAREDENLARQIRFLARAPRLQRESLVNTAIHEMTLRGEAAADRLAFSFLATDAGAHAALAFLGASNGEKA